MVNRDSCTCLQNTSSSLTEPSPRTQQPSRASYTPRYIHRHHAPTGMDMTPALVEYDVTG